MTLLHNNAGMTARNLFVIAGLINETNNAILDYEEFAEETENAKREYYADYGNESRKEEYYSLMHETENKERSAILKIKQTVMRVNSRSCEGCQVIEDYVAEYNKVISRCSF